MNPNPQPPPAAPAAPVVRGPVPWEQRDQLGLFPAFWAQLKETILEPTRFWQTVRPEGSAGDPFFYAWLITAIAGIGGIPYNAFNFWIQKNQFKTLPPSMLNDPGMKQFMSIFEWLWTHPFLAAGGTAVLMIVMFPVNFAIHAGLVHLGTMIFGLRKGDFTTTVRALGYASAPNILMVIPIVGGFAGFYTLVLQVWGLRDMHEGTTGKAIGSVIWYTLLLVCCVMCGAMAAVMSIASRVR
ncbi:MAG: YIP1 family protein [Archangium sp.]